MKELEHTMRSLGLEPCVIRGVQHLISAVGQLGLAELHSHDNDHAWAVRDVIEEIYARNPLRVRQAPLP